MFKVGDKVIMPGWIDPLTVTEVISWQGYRLYTCSDGKGVTISSSENGLQKYEPKAKDHRCSEFKKYVGFTDSFMYCVECNRKVVN